MATEGGAMAMRLGLNIGQIAPGFRADICLYRLGGPFWTPVNDPVAQLVFAETGGSVAYTLVDGDILVDQGRVTAFDAEGALAEVSGMVASLRRRNADLFSVAHAIAKALP
jgi:cytosine/adenosine deaminase-related metal-dependent hydrolase